MKFIFCFCTDIENTWAGALDLILGVKCQLEYPEENEENDTRSRNRS